MNEPSPSPLSKWRYGIHPRAAGMQVRALGRVELPLGEALRLEMAGDDEAGEDLVHLQYYIATEQGPWALWLSCSRQNVADREAAIRGITPPLAEQE